MASKENALNSEASARPEKKQNIFYNPTFRSVVFQFVAIVALVFFVFTIVDNALTNLDARGIATGFGFLSQEAGFGIGLTLIEYDETYSYGRTFFVGLLNTALVSVLGILLATVLGFLIGIARLSNNWLLSRFAAVYIETFRNIPLLLQIFFWYFAVLQALPSPKESLSIGESLFLNVRGLYFTRPVFEEGSTIIFVALIAALVFSFVFSRWAKRKQETTGVQTPVLSISLAAIVGLPLIAFFVSGMPVSLEYPVLKGFNFRGGFSIIPELAALMLALAIYTASFIAEIVRSGINAVSHGQTEAAMALGLPRNRTLRLVVIPQAMRIIIPPLTSQYLNLTKNSSLAMAIGYPDLVSVFAGTTLNQTGQAIEIIAMTMGVYLTLSLLTSMLMNIYNAKVALVER
ncbi:amino acid ABC transporter permease [Enterovibrio norvegicus]|uniref:General L-amino acid transport system permease protein n=1 Tax=Enterovibrio norvegicus DSM 15893 TaxID=1121869 RepID=A0A1I5UFJ1_9GAMM|nr:amino acid ABC transporter permease [Enterovibrio norvegicus]OEE65388.1 amino acid ABC transporter permease [Enterovibrio norvegicus]PMI34569.1 amino acid ABC transporter permease [Enterovibrio norvegicus]PMI37303.1 amino acid ABC transporter permease [Enterovibrio norvegicus]TKF10692.1 amino acid ABC transporter permease [Enterovibrio norvegicus]TKF37009.1 amino acid ABC transporter permease [Enterovibrio norvegicus]